MMDAFRYLNPFEHPHIHEDDVWGEEGTAVFDVEAIHAEVSTVLLQDLRLVTMAGRTRVRFLIGPAGVGKSHLFSRLRRQINEQAAFVFASLPPTRSEALPRWVLDRVVSGLQRPRSLGGNYTEYTQLDGLVYRLLIEYNPDLKGATESNLHDLLRTSAPEERSRHFTKLQNAMLIKGFNAELIGGILDVLQPEVRSLALRWLGGSENLTEDELAAIRHVSPLDDNAVQTLLGLLGRLAKLANLPIVLVLDQLDNMTEKGQIDALQDVLFTMLNNSYGWYVVVSLLQERYEQWSGWLHPPMRTRLQAQANGTLPVTELGLVADRNHKKALIEQRLASASLMEARSSEGITSPIYPLLPKDLDDLCNNVAAVDPRGLLTRAATLYNRRVIDPGSPEPPQRRSLSEWIASEYERRRGQIDPANLQLDRAAIADRVTEFVRLVALGAGIAELKDSVGPLERSGAGSGTHTVYNFAGESLNVVGHHMQRGVAFPNFGKKCLELPPGAIFVRDASAAISGDKSKAIFREIEQKHTFLWLTAPLLAELQTLMEILADMRAGDFRSLETDPPPTEDAILQALATLPALISLPLARVIRERLIGEKAEDRHDPAPAAVEPDQSAAIPGNVIQTVCQVMRPLRWLAMERLTWILQRDHSIRVGAEALAQHIRTASCSTQFEFYPPVVTSPGVPQILIYSEEGHA